MVKADLSRDYYADLELPPTADVNEIKKQFKKLALKYHPDRNIGREAEVNAKFQAIQSAHEVLTDSEQKAKYDAGRMRGRAFGSGFGSGMGAQRGNPYANAGSQWAPPPKRNPNARPNPPPPSAGAQRYKNFETPSAKPSAHKTAQEGAESRRSTYQAWENMRGRQDHSKPGYGAKPETGPGKAWSTPKAPPKEHTPQSGREESNNMKHSVPPRSRGYEDFAAGSMPRRSQSTKRPGFMPSDPKGDEPQAGSTSAYFTNRNRRTDVPMDVPPPPPRPPPVDPYRAFREKAGIPSEPRLSTPYSTHGGEKTNPFESANIVRSGSTRERPSSRPPSSTPRSPSGSSDRHRSASPPRSRRHRPQFSASFVPSTDSDPNMARQNVNPPRSSAYKPGHTPTVELDSTSSEDGSTRSVPPSQKAREYAKAKARRTASSTTRQPPPETENSKPNPPPVRDFRDWWRSRSRESETDQPLKDVSQGQSKNNANGQPMYAYSFNVIPPENKSAAFKLPSVSEAVPSRDGTFASDKDPYGLASNCYYGRSQMPSPFEDDKYRAPATIPTGASAHYLNSFEVTQRSIIDQLVSKPRKVDSPCNDSRKASGMASQPMPNAYPQSNQYRSVPNGDRLYETKSRPLAHVLSPGSRGSPVPKKRKSHSRRRSNYPQFEHNEPPKSTYADGMPPSSFSFNADGTAEKPPTQRFTSSSAENISTKFTPEDWHGKFQAGDYFMTEQKAANMPPGRTRSGSRPRGKSPIKSRPGSKPNLSTQAPIPDLEAPAEPETPAESPGGTRQFSAEEWAQTFKPQTFAPPLQPSPGTRPTYPPRKTSRTQRGSVPRPTMGTAAVIDDSDSSDEKPLFMGRKSSKPTGTSTSSTTSTRPPTSNDSPKPMDIDSEEPPRASSASRMAASALRKEGMAAFAKAAAEGQPRNVPLEPSRPEWRDTNGRVESTTVPQPESPRVTKSPGKRRATKSSDSEGFGSINFEDLKNAEPIKQDPKGLNGFEDLASSLPFQSQAASKIPISRSPKTGHLDLPKIPKAPNTVNAAQPASWQAYLSAFKTYMVDWDIFNCRIISHFTARRYQVQQLRDGWLGGIGDEPCMKYMEGVLEDKKVREWWDKAAETHEENMKTFMAMRAAAKQHFVGV